MELNNINLFTQNAAALNKTAKKEDKKSETTQEDVKDNKPAEKQLSGADVLSFMASKNIDLTVASKKTDSTKSTEDRISGSMGDFETAYNEAAKMGLSQKAILAILDKM